MSDFEAIVTDRAGQTRAYLDAHDLTQTRRLGNLGPSELTCWLDLDDPTAEEVTPGNRLLRVYRDGMLWFHGVVFPVTQQAGENEGRVMVAAFDPSAVLAHRFLRVANKRTWTQIDQGTIARELVTDQMAAGGGGGPTGQGFTWYAHLEALAGDVAVSVKRDRTYDIGKQVLEAIQQIGDVDDGFYYRVDPVAYPSTWGFGSTGASLKQIAAGELKILWPESGVDREGLRFEYGEETADTLQEVERTLGLPTNRVLASGEEGTLTPQEVTDAASEAQFGVWMVSETFSDVRQKATLIGHAQARLRPTLADAEVVTFIPAQEGPMLIDDFDVGDTGRMTARRGALQTEARVRVLECTVTASDDGAETITGLSVERA